MRHFGRTVLTTLLVVGGLVSLSSCNIVAPLSYAVMGQPKTEAAYILQPRTTLVFVDDRLNKMPSASQRRLVAEAVGKELMSRKLVSAVIDPAPALNYVRRETNDEPIAIADIGRQFSAEQIIYIEIDSFQLALDQRLTPTAVGTVRVLDIVNNVRLFPEGDERAYTVTTLMRDVNMDRYTSRSGLREVQDNLAKALGVDIARVFYKHVPDEIGSRLNPR